MVCANLFVSPRRYALWRRKTPVAYPDGVYEIAGGDRGNVMLIANITQHGLTGLGSTRRTALFTFFGNSGNRYSSLC